MELLITHLIVSLYVIDILLVIGGIIFIGTLWGSKDFSNSVVVVIFMLALLFVNMIWLLLGLPPMSF
jgi:hypothetical protein